MLGLYYHFFQSLEHELALDYSALFWASIRVVRKGEAGLNDVFWVFKHWHAFLWASYTPFGLFQEPRIMPSMTGQKPETPSVFTSCSVLFGTRDYGSNAEVGVTDTALQHICWIRK